MSEFNGTPGPWYRGGVENNKVSINAGNYFVTLVDESSAQLANARLISAAPELLEALQDAEKALFAALDNAFGEELANGNRELIQARAAIAKALGQ